MTHGYAQAREIARNELILQGDLVRAGDPQPLNIPLLLGPPGIGKTALVRSLSTEFARPLFAVNSGENSDATDLSGIPNPMAVKRTETGVPYTEWALNEMAARACTEPVLLFFDDLDKAPPAVQNALLGITANRMFRNHVLHPETLLIGAGNRMEDDTNAGDISESLRTRMTILEMKPDILAFSNYGRESGEIHEAVLGFLQYRPHLLYAPNQVEYRFPTPRCWREVSQHFYKYQDSYGAGSEPNWKGIVSRKCGVSAANDFWGWFSIVANVDVEGVLATGDIAGEEHMAQFAIIYAVASELNRVGPKKSHTGFTVMVNHLAPEMRVALLVQLTNSTRRKIAKAYPEAANLMLSDIVSTGQSHVLVRKDQEEAA